MSSPTVALVLCALQWEVIDRAVMVVWASLHLALAAARLLLYRAFCRRDLPEAAFGAWGRRYMLLLFLNGCLWGLGSLIMFAPEPRTQILLMIIFMLGISAGGGISSYTVHYPTLLAYFVPVILPGTVRLFASGGTYNLLLGVAMLVYSLVVLSATRRMNSAMVKAIQANLELEGEMAERQKAEQALAQSHHQLQLITDNIPACIALVDAEDMKYRFVNRQHLEKMGHSPEDIIGKPVAEVLGQAAFDFAKPYIDQALSGRSVSYVNLVELSEGPRWINVNYVPNVDESGQVTGIVVLTHDITDSKRDEEALKHSEEQHRRLAQEANEARELYRSLLESTPDSIVMYDMSGKVTYVNDAFVRTFGWRLEELSEGVPYTPESENEITTTNVRKVVELGKPVSDFETKRLTKDGELVEVSISASRFYDHQGEPSGMLVILRDISSRLNMERQLVAAKEDAEAASRAKSDFLANMSHELRTPLNAIIGFAELLSRDSGLSAEQLGNLETITRSGGHLLSLINDVLEFSKIEAGRAELHPEEFDLERTLAGLNDMFRLRAGQKGIGLEFSQGPGVPRHVWADKSRLRQVLINLLGNAVKFTDRGGVTLKVARDPAGDGDNLWLRFEVSDTGLGIDGADRDQVFDAFYQAQTPRSPKQGTGLGLPISQRFVEMMGGRLRFRSEPGQGSVFWFSIPMQEVMAPTTAAPEPSGQVVGLEPGQPELRLLVAEDNENSRELLVKLLRSVGLSVEEAADGQEAVAVWQQWRPHFIWMDMRMPVMNGYEATARIKASPGGDETVIVAITASAFEEDRKKVIEHGCDDFVRKPFREQEIFEMLEKHLGARFVRRPTGQTASPYTREQDADSIRASLSALPEKLRASLAKAAREVDFDSAMKTVGLIESIDADLAGHLAGLVTAYRFDSLQFFMEDDDG